MSHFFKSTKNGERLPALYGHVCGECAHIDTTHEETSWGFPCSKTRERQELFYEENRSMDIISEFLSSPDLWVRELYLACPFFEYNRATEDDL